jgi:aspartyl-tRNA(Asn)/glutamyl-tRNA(Gln) amidotransferase subunit C
MQVDEATVRRIARLARIRVGDEEAHHLVAELSAILSWVEQLDEVATDGVAPMTSVIEARIKMRDDVVNDGDDAARVLANAPRAEDGYFVVPKVVE